MPGKIILYAIVVLAAGLNSMGGGAAVGQTAGMADAAAAAGPVAAGTRVSVPGGRYRALTPHHLQALLRHKTFVLVNVHVPYAGEIAHTDLFIPFGTIDRNLGRLPASKRAMIVLYCRSGRMSDIAARRLVRLGYANIWTLSGGMDAWRRQGLPLMNVAANVPLSSSSADRPVRAMT